MLFALLIIIVLVVVQYKLRKTYKYWIERDVPQVSPQFLVGNMGPLVFRTSSIAKILQDSYNEFPGSRYYGIYQFLKPTLVLRCPDLIKTVMIKEFDTFPEHRVMLPPENDPLFSNNVFSMRGGQRWTDIRSILSPLTTSGKLKSMFGLIQQCSKQCVKHIEKQKGALVFNMDDIFTRYTNDVIGSTAFGVTCNSFENPDNEFYAMGRESTKMTPWKSLKLFLHSFSPLLVKIFKISLLTSQADKFFRSVTNESLRLREQQNIIRPDVINILMEARRTKSEVALTDEDIAANAFMFFLAGLDSISRALSFTSYELALNPDIQRKLQQEVDAVLELGDVTYTALFEMKYMDMVVSESLRKWPPVMMTERTSVKPFTIEAEHHGEKNLNLDKQSDVWVPIYALHRDPQYYPEPDKYDPERFNDINKQKINSNVYLPFGAGPRNCIGLRFALLEVKLLIFNILSKFDIVPTTKTPIPLVLGKGQLFPTIEGGLWLELKQRERA